MKGFVIFITITTFRALNAYTSVVERCSHLGSIELIVIINILDFCDAQRPFQAALDVCSPRGLIFANNYNIKSIVEGKGKQTCDKEVAVWSWVVV